MELYVMANMVQSLFTADPNVRASCPVLLCVNQKSSCWWDTQIHLWQDAAETPPEGQNRVKYGSMGRIPLLYVCISPSGLSYVNINNINIAINSIKKGGKTPRKHQKTP